METCKCGYIHKGCEQCKYENFDFDKHPCIICLGEENDCQGEDCQYKPSQTK